MNYKCIRKYFRRKFENIDQGKTSISRPKLELIKKNTEKFDNTKEKHFCKNRALQIHGKKIKVMK